ncbi:MAG: EamA family transporter [Phycisphaera sp.]|nr:EamA family transporter [Phycisphaera sp.]
MAIPFAGEAAAFGAAMCWTVGSQCIEAAGHRVGSLTVNLLRLVVAFVVLVVVGLIARGQPVPLDFPSHAWNWLIVSGLIGMFIGDMCLFRAFVEIGPRVAMLVMTLNVPMTAIIGRLWLGESYSGFQWLCMAITLGGVVWVIMERRDTAVIEGGGDPPGDHAGRARRAMLARRREGATGGLPTSASIQQSNAVRTADGDMRPFASTGGQAASGTQRARRHREITLRGVLLALGGAVGQAVGAVTSKQGMGDLDAFAATQVRFLGAMLGFVVLFTVIGRWRRVAAALTDRRAMGFTFAAGCIGTAMGVGLFLYSLHHITTGVSATIISTVPILLIPFAVFLHKEHVSPRAVLGALIAVAGVAMLVWDGPGVK